MGPNTQKFFKMGGKVDTRNWTQDDIMINYQRQEFVITELFFFLKKTYKKGDKLPIVLKVFENSEFNNLI